MGQEIERRIKSIAALSRNIHLCYAVSEFWYKAWKGIAPITGNGHDFTMITLKVLSAMVFMREKDGISHSPKE
jgi:N-carbamoyl-L-amino-acid hydrolase